MTSTEEEAIENEDPGVAAWGAEYGRNIGAWEDFTARLEQLVRDLLDDEGLETVQIESRTKSVESFVGKLKRKNSKYADPLREVTDLAGVRIITYYVEDVERVVTCLQQEFAVLAEHSRGAVSAVDPDRFGYRSSQYVMRLSAKRGRLPEWRQYGEHCVEIQVRTALQHAWSAIDHKLNYKAEREVPRHLKRRLSRLSALLEIADEQFSSLRDATDDLDAEYANEIAKGHFDLDVDISSVDAYISATGAGERWVSLALEAGYWPRQDNAKQIAKDRSDLLLVLQRLGVGTIKELHELLTAAERSWGLEILKQLNERGQELGYSSPLPASAHEVLTQVVMVACGAAPEVTSVYNQGTAGALNEAIQARANAAGQA